MLRKLSRIIERPFYYTAGLCSVASVVMLCFSDKTIAIVALAVFCMSLILFLYSIIRVLNRFIEKDKSDHKTVSSFISYKSDDGENITIEAYKLIQAKCSILQTFDSGFKWSGDDSVKISSDLQRFINVKDGGVDAFDSAILEFKTPVLFNETTVVHFKAESSDPNRTSLPYIEIPVTRPVEYIQVSVYLGYKDQLYNQPAKISRRRIHDGSKGLLPQDHKVSSSVPFDQLHKQYVYRLINPEVGYDYKISWER